MRRLQKEGVKVASVGSTGGETGSSRDEHRVDAAVRRRRPDVTIRARARRHRAAIQMIADWGFAIADDGLAI